LRAVQPPLQGVVVGRQAVEGEPGSLIQVQPVEVGGIGSGNIAERGVECRIGLECAGHHHEGIGLGIGAAALALDGQQVGSRCGQDFVTLAVGPGGIEGLAPRRVNQPPVARIAAQGLEEELLAGQGVEAVQLGGVAGSEGAAGGHAGYEFHRGGGVQHPECIVRGAGRGVVAVVVVVDRQDIVARPVHPRHIARIHLATEYLSIGAAQGPIQRGVSGTDGSVLQRIERQPGGPIQVEFVMRPVVCGERSAEDGVEGQRCLVEAGGEAVVLCRDVAGGAVDEQGIAPRSIVGESVDGTVATHRAAAHQGAGLRIQTPVQACGGGAVGLEQEAVFGGSGETVGVEPTARIQPGRHRGVRGQGCGATRQVG